MRLILAAAAALLAAPAIAEPTTGEPASETKAETEQASAEPKEEEKICRNISQVGSRKKERKCFTRKDWIRFNRGE